ncbi:MAG: hypothetical protein OJF60_001644 [Burkholderiaceae bacterium]|jgi:hypothetical protein|nr:MAG: hypothetical protein OJF60_001644 [Burkholderiaceae bacterium]
MKHVRSHLALYCLRFCLLALAFVPLIGSAAGIPAGASAFERMIKRENGKQLIIDMNRGAGEAVSTVPTAGAGWVVGANSGFGVSKAANVADGMVVQGTGQVAVLPGVVVPVTATTGISAADLVAGLKVAVGVGASLVGGPWGVALLGTGAVLDWLISSGGRVNPQTGQLERSSSDGAVQSTGFEYRSSVSVGGQFTDFASTVQGACDLVSAKWPQYVNNPALTDVNASGGIGRCYFSGIGYQPNTRRAASCSAGWWRTSDGQCVQDKPVVWLPSSMDDIAPYMQAVQPDPAVVPQLLGAGASFQMGPLTISAPATVQGPTSTTINNDNSKTTTTTTYNITTSGDTITNVSTNKTVTNQDAAGNTTSSSTTTTQPGDAGDKPPPTDCDKHPDALGCTPLGTPDPAPPALPQRDIPVTLTPIDFANSPSCPADISVPVHFGTFSATATFSFAGICDATTRYVRPVVLLMAYTFAAIIVVGGLLS